MDSDDDERAKDSLLTENVVVSQGGLVEEEDDQDETQERSWFQRTFGKMNQGSLRSSIFTLMASAMGTGLFSFPYIASKVGLGMTIIDIMIGCAFSLISMFLLMSIALPKKVKSYNDLAELAYGRWLKRVSEFCIIIYSWGITICFQVIFAKFVVEAANEIFGVDVYANPITHELNHTGNTIRLVSNALNISINMIFILKKDLYSLRFITLLGTFFVFYNAFVILITAFTGFELHDGTHIPPITKKDYSGLRMFNFDQPLQLMAAVANTVFCFVNHQMIFPLAHELKRPSLIRLKRIFNRAHFFESSVYLTVVLFGYLLVFELQIIQPIVIESIRTVPMLVGKCLMMITLFFAVPLNTMPAREMFFSSTGIVKSTKNHVLVSCGFAFIGCGIAMVFVKVNSYFGLLGGSCGTLMAGTIPAMIWLKMTKLPLTHPKCLGVLVFYATMTGVGFTGAVASVISS